MFELGCYLGVVIVTGWLIIWSCGYLDLGIILVAGVWFCGFIGLASVFAGWVM